MLSGSGAAAAVVLGAWVAFFAGMIWLLPPLFFFGSSTLIGRMKSQKKIVSDKKHGKGRDAWQVLFNGGIYGLLATFSGQATFAPVVTLMGVSLAISTSDTWSSEVGIFFRGKTMDILRWRRVPPGLSGGVSLEGTLAGLVGAAALAALVSLLYFGRIEGAPFMLVALAGFAGMLLDSVLGAGLQARFRDPETGSLSDTGTELYSGWEWMSNDLVNLISNVLVTGGVSLGLLV